MKTMRDALTHQRGAIGKALLVLLALVAVAGLWLALDEDAGKGLKKEAQLAALDVIGDAATQRLGGGDGDGQVTHGSAVDLIKRPIEVKEIAENVYLATGVGNVMMITTDEGNVIFDTGLVLQTPKQLKALREVSDAPIRYIVLSHSHADHIGGTRFFAEEGTQIIAHEQFEEEQRYLTELEPYQYQRNRTLFPWMPAWEERPDIAMMRYGGIVPDITVDDWQTHSFTLGDVEFQVIAAPGAEGADNIVMWLPEQKILFTGDACVNGAFNYTGQSNTESWITILNRMLELPIKTLAPGHGELGTKKVIHTQRRYFVELRGAIQKSIDQGKKLKQIKKDIDLPFYKEWTGVDVKTREENIEHVYRELAGD